MGNMYEFYYQHSEVHKKTVLKTFIKVAFFSKKKKKSKIMVKLIKCI